ncbi:MAG: hypothetical protein Q8M66_01450 [Actinomycetota bacterium]|nr:hypothetical protein [Actinomycetota bacterium]MDZ4178946.1 hypothetical protein [Coriobacteriia bacterium]
MPERILILGPESATFYEPRLRGEHALPLDYFRSYVRLMALAADDQTGVYLTKSHAILGSLGAIDLGSLEALDAEQARRLVRQSYHAAGETYMRKLDRRLVRARRGGGGDAGGWGDCGGGVGGGGGGDCGGGGGGGGGGAG